MKRLDIRCATLFSPLGAQTPQPTVQSAIRPTAIGVELEPGDQMAVADMLPTMDDKALGVLRDNAARLQLSAEGAKQEQAAQLLPLIDAELAERLAKKPPKPARAKAKAKAKPRVKAPSTETAVD